MRFVDASVVPLVSGIDTGPDGSLGSSIMVYDIVTFIVSLFLFGSFLVLFLTITGMLDLILG